MSAVIKHNEIQWQINQPWRIAVIGECMLEMTETNGLACNYAGDTLNTAVYLTRELVSAQVDYITALGDDPFSDSMIAAWQKEGLGTDVVARIANKLPGLYWVKTDEAGERSFYYWREQSAACELMRAIPEAALLNVLKQYNFIYLSGITLAILDDESRTDLLKVLQALKSQGVVIGFDTNYRPRLWDDEQKARDWMQRILECTDIALVGFEDEVMLFRDRDAQEVGQRLQTYGVKEIVIKNGANSCLIFCPENPLEVLPKTVKKQVDTTAAGDSFNAAYIAARIQGLSIVQAAQNGHTLAAKVIQCAGAIIPIETC